MKFDLDRLFRFASRDPEMFLSWHEYGVEKPESAARIVSRVRTAYEEQQKELEKVRDKPRFRGRWTKGVDR